MNEISKLLRSQRFLLAALSVVLGAFATFLVQAYVARTIDAISGGALVPIIAAARPIAAGQTIADSDLKIRRMPASYVHVQAAGAASRPLLVGQKTSVPLRADQPILWTEVVMPTEESLSDLLRVNERAVTIKVDSSSSFSGMIRPGDRVDVLRVGRGGGLGSAAELKVLLQAALVLAVDGQTRPAALAEPGARGRGVGTITLRVAATDAPRLLLAEADGRIALTLRNPGDIFTATLPDTAAQDAPAGGGIVSSAAEEKVSGYPTVYVEGKKRGSGYYPPPSLAPEELRRLSPRELRERLLDYSAQREGAPGNPPQEVKP